MINNAGCDKCGLCKLRKNIVNGSGNPSARIFIVGEGPGLKEDVFGQPFCVEEQTLVLRADLRWVPIKDVNIGDKIISVDEFPSEGNGTHPWRVATVSRKFVSQKECVEVRAKHGSVTCTPDHKFLANRRWQFIEAQKLWFGNSSKNHKLVKLLQPWSSGTTYDHGWLGGFFDGEGHIRGSRGNPSTRAKGLVGFSQNSGETFDLAVEKIRKIGFNVREDIETTTTNGIACNRRYINGGFSESLKFLGVVRPERLIRHCVDAVIPAKGCSDSSPEEILDVVPVGIKTVIDITTDCGTFLANGYVVHNCGPAGSLLKKLMAQAGLEHREVFFSNTVRCLPKGTAKAVREPSYEEIEACAPYLEQEIAAVKPSVIVPAGNTALRYILGAKNLNISRQRGLEIWSDKYNCKVMPIYHPAAILRNPKYENVTVQDLIRIKSSSMTASMSVSGMGNYEIADTPEKLNILFKALETEPEIAIDLETTGLDWMKSQIISIGFSWQERTGWCLPFLNSKKTEEEAITRFWDDATFLKITEKLKKALKLPSKKIFHNSKFDLKHLIYNGFEVSNAYFDTMLAHHLIDENAENLHGLKDCSWVYTDMGGYDKEVSDFFTVNKTLKKQYIMLPFNILAKYNAADADCTFRLFKKFEPVLQAQGLLRLKKQIINPMRDVLLQTELVGVQVDTEYIEKLRVEYTAKKAELETSIFAKTGEFNINSAKELREVLYEKNKFKTARATKKGAMSTDKGTLAELVKEYPAHEIPKLLLQYRETSKMLSTFIEGLSEWLDDDGRVHSTYKQHGTVTGRLSSAEPNLQNIPRDSTIRGLFVAKPGHSLIEADYGQAEFRFWALYSQDPQMIVDISSGQDIHKMTASSAFGVPLNLVTKKQRQDAKAIVFGLMYGRGTWSVAQQLGISEEEAEKVVQIFFGRYPKAKRWLKDTVTFARQKGYVINHFGRIRRLPGINSTDEIVRSEAERQAKNSPIQSGASDMTCVASCRIKNAFAKKGLAGQLVLTVHDSVIYEVPNSEMEESLSIVKTEIERPIEGINVPMVAEIKSGLRWGALDEMIKKEGKWMTIEEAKKLGVK